MPGNVKLGSSNEPDPDPMPYLAVSNDTKRRAFEHQTDSNRNEDLVYFSEEGNSGFSHILSLELS